MFKVLYYSEIQQKLSISKMYYKSLEHFNYNMMSDGVALHLIKSMQATFSTCEDDIAYVPERFR